MKTACTSTVESECRNGTHDHTGQIDAWENGDNGTISPRPTSDYLRCGDCDAPMHYDYGDEAYHHNDPNAPACFLIRDGS